MLEKHGSEYLRTEYRINKKGAECYRTENREDAFQRLESLREKRPSIYTMQTRYRRENKYGQPIISHNDGWSLWG